VTTGDGRWLKDRGGGRIAWGADGQALSTIVKKGALTEVCDRQLV
jgi:hypothetical protein